MTKRSITAEDLYKLSLIEDPRISPDGQWVAYVRVTVDKMENGYKRNIWLSPTAGGNAIQLTRSGKDSTPRWSPDGKTLAFVSSRADKPQIFLLPVTAPGGEARQFTSMANGAGSPEWSPDGTQLLFLAGMNADERAKEDSGEKPAPPVDKLEGKHRNERRDEDEKKKIDPRIHERIPYRVGTAYNTDRYQQIYVMLVTEDAKPRRLTNVDANHISPRWSADGQFIYACRPANIEADEPFRQARLYRINVENGEHERLTGDDFGDYEVIPSPDGHWLAIARFPLDEVASMRLNRLSVMPVGGTTDDIRDLNMELDLQPAAIRWHEGSLYFSAEGYGSSAIYRVSPEGGEVVKVVGGERKQNPFDISANGQIAAAVSTPEHPQELFLYRDGEELQLTNIHKSLMEELTVQPANRLVYKAPDGYEIEGWYILPTDYEQGKQYPLILNIHGGPHIMWGPSDENMWLEWQYHAARGYVVFYCNPRGSAGYGENHQLAVFAQWGDLAYGDIMMGLEALLNTGFVDPDRLGVTGGSYGGYMTTWILAHTDRFKAGVSQRGVYNLLSFFGTSDIPSFVLNEFGVTPLDDPTFLWNHSPLAHAHKIKAPLLIMHSENDFRVPVSEGEQLFGYLRRNGVTTQLVRYPREGHELTRTGEPEHRIDNLKRVVDWFDEYCK